MFVLTGDESSIARIENRSASSRQITQFIRAILRNSFYRHSRDYYVTLTLFYLTVEYNRVSGQKLGR